MTAWLALLLAGVLEVVWALSLKATDGLTRFWPLMMTLSTIILSFGLFTFSLKAVPFGTAYAVWAGIGAAGSMIAGMVLFGESADAFRIACLTLIIGGMIGLKLAPRGHPWTGKRRPSRGSRRNVAVALAFTPSDLGCSFVLWPRPRESE